MTNTASVTSINPTTWNSAFRYDQAQLRPAPTQLLTLAGQGAAAPDGSIRYPGETAPQLEVAMANVEALLAAGGMDLGDVLSMTIYATDVDAALAGYGAITERLDVHGATPPATLVGVARLALPEMAVEITVSAGR